MEEIRKDLIYRLKTGILVWYPFKAGKKVLCIEDEKSLSDYLAEKGMGVQRKSIRESANSTFIEDNKATFDYVVVIGMLEYCREPQKMLQCWKTLLKGTGHLILGINNRLGIKYFCGDKDPFTGKIFDGIQNYRGISKSLIEDMGGRLYSHSEVSEMLLNAGFSNRKIYSVFPNLERARFIFSVDYTPNEDLAVRIVPKYYSPRSVFLDEQHIYNDLVKNNMFHQMANAYFIDCVDEITFDIKHVTLSVERSLDKKFATIVEDGYVTKYALYTEGIERLKMLQANLKELEGHGIRTVKGKLRGNKFRMPFIKGELAVFYLRRLLLEDVNEFIRQMDHFRDLILKSSEHVNDNADNIILKHGFVDMVPINCFYEQGEFVFIDQEFMIENYPANAIIFRLVSFVYNYNQNTNLENILNEKFFMDRYGLSDQLEYWLQLSQQFTDELCDSIELHSYLTKDEVNMNETLANRNWINEGFIDKDNLLRNCFTKIKGKNVYLFGTGRYADKFYAFYNTHYNIEGVVDNNIEKWGKEYKGKCILPPQVLHHIDLQNSKVIICMKDYKDVYFQLSAMGIANIGLYQADYIYEGRQNLFKLEGTCKKKYKIGYVAGVFDLFHIGHLNMFRRAKEQCDYLIVGVVSDEQVRCNKHKEPFIPFKERLEIVRSCKYVDEANEIPINYSGTVEAFQTYHFDVQFSGSDYIHDAWWLQQKAFLEEHGADLVFYPYTESTSSTMLQEAIRSNTEN